MAVANNVFANATTLDELSDMFEGAVSPENLHHDGERTRAQAKAAYKKLQNHYQHRESELRLAEINAHRATATTLR
jgi:hypothetical protein